MIKKPRWVQTTQGNKYKFKHQNSHTKNLLPIIKMFMQVATVWGEITGLTSTKLRDDNLHR